MLRARSETIIESSATDAVAERTLAANFRLDLRFTCVSLIPAEIPRVVQTQGTAGEESGEHEDDDDDERGYDGRAGE